jgi:predicted ATP-binding protein involved in virulence
MFLKTIRLKNFKGLKDIELSFEQEDNSIRKLTLLLGENGTGKSTLLKALALIMLGSEAISDVVLEPDLWINNDSKYCELTAVVETKEGDERKISLKFNRGDTRAHVIRQNTAGLRLLDDALEHTPRNYFVVGYGASRRINRESTTRSSKTSEFTSLRAQSVATLFDPAAVLNPLETWAMDVDYTQPNGLNIVHTVLSGLLEGITFSHINKDRRELYFKTPDGIVPLQSLSDGFQTFAAWMGDLLYRISKIFKDYSSPLETRGLLLIDEVDLHLHPKWQRQLLSFLDNKLPNFQIVATSHSPMTAQQASAGSLFYLSRDDGSVELEQFAADPQKLQLDALATTNAFGLESVESLDVEIKKERYRHLEQQSKLSSTERAEKEELAEFLTGLPIDKMENLVVRQEQVELLRDIEQELKGRKS